MRACNRFGALILSATIGLVVVTSEPVLAQYTLNTLSSFNNTNGYKA
jgi:hypothetical protein